MRSYTISTDRRLNFRSRRLFAFTLQPPSIIIRNYYFLFFFFHLAALSFRTLKRINNDDGRVIFRFLYYNALFFNFLKSFLMAFGKWGVKKKINKYKTKTRRVLSESAVLIVYYYYFISPAVTARFHRDYFIIICEY